MFFTDLASVLSSMYVCVLLALFLIQLYNRFHGKSWSLTSESEHPAPTFKTVFFIVIITPVWTVQSSQLSQSLKYENQ